MQLFTPIRLAELEVRNRFVHSATQECMASSEGLVTDELIHRYVNLAKGEVGLIIPGDMYVHPMGKSRYNQTGIDSDVTIDGLKRLVGAVHEHGSKIVFQLAHAGGQTSKKVIGGTPLAPSNYGRDPVYFGTPKEMDEDEILTAVKAFSDAAGRAVEAGADGIRLHAAHGYLINEFLSPFFNLREDSWGGSEENRFRFLGTIISEVRKVMPAGMPLLVKLNTHDHTPRPGILPELAMRYAERIARIGVEGVELSSGSSSYSFMAMCRGEVPVKELVEGQPFLLKVPARIQLNRLVGKFDMEEGYHLDAARLIRPVLGSARLLLVGGLRTVRFMEEVIQQGHADMVSMSRPFIREPFLVKRIREGKTDRTSCISCNRCLARIARYRSVRCEYKPTSQN
ncbi:MAG: NADH:flavin oxidoreductase [Thermodesulfobacteriota bacterium]